MRFRVEQVYDAPADAVLDVYCDPAFYGALEGLAKIDTPVVLEHRIEGDHVILAVRYRFAADLPAAAARVLDSSRLTWIERSTIDRTTRATRAELVPDHYADKLRSSATAVIEDLGPGRCRRVVQGELRVRMPLVGGQVERAIVSGLQEHLADEATVVRRRLATS